LAESFERIYRANLVSVGILPLTFTASSNRKILGLNGREQFRVSGLSEALSSQGLLKLHIVKENGSSNTVDVKLNLETGKESRTLRSGGLLQVLLRELVSAEVGRVSQGL
jgi:aconitate hydratase